MGNIDNISLKNELFRQNPWWEDSSVLAENIVLSKRDIYQSLINKINGNDLIIAITGLRRIGKTTIVKQIINELIKTSKDRSTILYFSLDEINLIKYPQLLEKIIDFQINKKPENNLFFFFDEIQYVNNWNAILKKYYDSNHRLKFIITGSSSLFIKTEAKESLAGRILETIMTPLSFGEYLRIIKNINLPDAPILSTNILKQYKEMLQENFIDYLSFGEFPYLPKLDSFSDRKQYVLDWVIGKIVENDLPKLRRFVHAAALLNLTNVLITGSGQIVELQNLARDIGIDRKTLVTYISLLEKTHIIHVINNLGASFRSRSNRQRKIYPSSVNTIVYKNTSGSMESINLHIGQIIENYVSNYLHRNTDNVSFWRKRGKEVDFIIEKEDRILPIEVKYQSKIKSEDIKTIIYLCHIKKLSEAIIISRDEDREIVIGKIKIKIIPAYYLI